MKEVFRWFPTLALLAALNTTGAPPVIEVQPEDQAALAGGMAVFRAQVSGTTPLYLQWRATLGNAFTNIPGATSSILTLTNVQTTARRFALVVTNAEGAVTSRLAAITVLRPPEFSTHPASAVAIDGSDVSLTATLTGTAPMQYQWFFNGTALPGQTSLSLSLRAVSSTEEGDYWMVATNGYGQSTSRLARLAVIPDPASLEPRLFTGVPALPLPYRLFTPTSASGSPPKGPYPLVLFLHGAGERGDNNYSQVADWPHAMVFVSHANQARTPLVEGVTRIGVVASTSSLAPALGGATTLNDTIDLEYHIPISLAASRDGETLRLDWAGGKGTFYLETSPGVSPPVWGSRVPLLQPSITLPITGGNACFRVVRE